MLGLMTTLLIVALVVVLFGIIKDSAAVIIIAALILAAISVFYIGSTIYGTTKESSELREETFETTARRVLSSGTILSKVPVKVSFSNGESRIFMRYIVLWEGCKFLIELEKDGRVLTYQNIYTDEEP